MAVDLVPTVASLALTCLCQVVNAAANPPAECCLRLPGSPAMDFSAFTDKCCEGLAYVSMGDMWPIGSSGFPNTDTDRQADGCVPTSWGVELRMGIIRCVPTVGETDLDPPTCAQYTAAALQNMIDAQSLRQASCCFFQVLPTELQERGMGRVIGRQTASEAQGGCIERYVTIHFEIPAYCDGC